MHQSALKYGKAFFDTYSDQTATADLLIIDIGAQDVNGSLRSVAPTEAKYVGVDFVEGKGVDVILTDPYHLPFEDCSVDMIVCSSVFEHSEFFWLLFLECLRILKPTGLLYVNAPSNGIVHRYPVDVYRFYPDAGHALVNWAHRQGMTPVLLESFIAPKLGPVEGEGMWNDFVAVFVKDEACAKYYRHRILDDEPGAFCPYASNRNLPRPHATHNPDYQLLLSNISDKTNMTQAISERDDKLREMAKTIATQQQHLDLLTNAIADREKSLTQTRSRLHAIETSTTWQVAQRAAWLPEPVRKWTRRLLKAIWWTITGQLSARLQARKKTKEGRNQETQPLPSTEQNFHELFTPTHETSLPKKVTVIVPNYNCSPYLKKRLDSIYNQTYKNIEVILLDDCSTDDSKTVLQAYAQENSDITRIIFNDKNSGTPFRQWAKGIHEAHGDIIWIAESDDYCDENFLETLIQYFSDEAVMLAYARTIVVDAEGNEQPETLEHYVSDLEDPDRWKKNYVETAHREVLRALGIKNTIPNASGVLFRRPVELSLLNDESWLSMRSAGDWVFYLHIIRGGKIAYSSSTKNYYRRHLDASIIKTQNSDSFYNEIGLACHHIHTLYNAPTSLLDKCEEHSRNIYLACMDKDTKKFDTLFNRGAVERARIERLPSVMLAMCGFSAGGGELAPIRLANELKRQGLSVTFLSSDEYPYVELVRQMLRSDIPVIRNAPYSSIKSTIDAFGIEVVNSHHWSFQRLPALYPDTFIGCRAHVATLHGMIENREAFGVTDEQIIAANRNVSTWIYTADKNVLPFRSLALVEEGSKRFVKLPNGFEPLAEPQIPRKQLGIPDSAFILCCVSRAIPEKGWYEAIQAVTQARKQSGKDIHLILVGYGEIYDKLSQTIVPDYVHLVGFSSDSAGYYAASDMGIMLTTFKSESFPLTILDCINARKPYIASDIGSIREMLSEGNAIAGAVIPLEDWRIPIDTVAQVIAAFAQDASLYASACAVVPAVAQRYRIDTVASQYAEIFKRDCTEDSIPSSRSAPN